jgi:hypothetical protein
VAGGSGPHGAATASLRAQRRAPHRNDDNAEERFLAGDDPLLAARTRDAEDLPEVLGGPGALPGAQTLAAGRGALTGFGVNLCRLPPGAWSSQRHWHSHDDEFVYVDVRASPRPASAWGFTPPYMHER